MMNDDILEASRLLHARLSGSGITVATAESCTGGGVACAITSQSGSSDYFKGGVVAYSNEIKMELLRVKPETLEGYGAVSEQTVCEMVRGAVSLLKTDFAVATSGVAGPTGGSRQKPVGTVWIAAGNSEKQTGLLLYDGDFGRAANVKRAILKALVHLLEVVNETDSEKREK